MRIAEVAALALWAAAGPVAGQTVLMPGGPPVSAEIAAAFAKVRSGDSGDLMRLAASGHPEAQTYAGLLLAFTGETEEQRRKGCGWLEAASASRSDAMHALGEAYQYGRCGGAIDLDKAIATFRKAGDMGMAKSRCAEGNVLIELGRDQARAVELCQQGAEAGDRDAQTDLGNFYLEGKIVPRDVATARSWYEKAARQGQANASFVLGQIYWNADGVPRDVERAKALWLAAYDGGRADAAFHLGNALWVLSQRGEKTWDPTLLDQAAGWYDKAATAGAPNDRQEAVERRDLARQLAATMRKRR